MNGTTLTFLLIIGLKFNKMKISVIICCYNSLNESNQRLNTSGEIRDVAWEVILVNNNSNDNTSKIAQELWDSFKCFTPFRIVDEPQPGLVCKKKKSE